MLQKDLHPPPHEPPRRGRALKATGVVLALLMGFLTTLYWIYGTDTLHANRNTIWWSVRCRNLIPPAAANITLRQDFLDHYAIYTIPKRDLNTFLDKRFARPGTALDSFSERRPVASKKMGKPVGPLGWIATEDTVTYTFVASNGGAHNFYHDPNTGQTYQDSAYW